jgi:thiamine-monophosphate kinase
VAEFDLIDILRERCAIARADVRLGIGDDGAILAPPPGHDLVVSTDTLVAGVHFPLSTAADAIGWKALAVNLSDLAAMGATPAWALLALTLPDADRAFVRSFADGFADLAGLHHVALVGGDTTAGPLTVTIVVHGFVPPGQALRRDGAEVGDQVFVTGTLGDAAGALRCLDVRRGMATSDAPDLRDALLQRLHWPTPRVAAGSSLRGLASSCIDVSDGLRADLAHIATSSGVGIDITAADLPASSALMTLFDADERLALQAAGGDDYELAFTASDAHAGAIVRDLTRVGCGVTRIGRVVAGAGVRLLDTDGVELVVERRGWEHFA